MTEQEYLFLEGKKVEIEKATDCSVAFHTIPCPYYEQRTMIRTLSSATIGYQIIETYVWEDAYNTQGRVAGVNLVDIIIELKEINTEGVE